MIKISLRNLQKKGNCDSAKAVFPVRMALRSYDQVLLQVGYFITFSPELKPNKITDDEVKNKSRIELRLTEPLPIVNKKMRAYS